MESGVFSGNNDSSDLVRRFFSGTASSYDRVVNVCTWQADRWWKRKIMGKIPKEPERILDQACGTGILTLKIARRFPDCRVVGVDVSEEYLAIARRKAQDLELANVRFMCGRAEDIVLDEAFDCITSSYLAKYADLRLLIPKAGKMLGKGGTLIMHDFTYPTNPLFSRIWELYFKVLRTAGAWKYREWKNAFEGLPDLLRKTDWVGELHRCLRESCFSRIIIEPLTLGASTIVSAEKGSLP